MQVQQTSFPDDWQQDKHYLQLMGAYAEKLLTQRSTEMRETPGADSKTNTRDEK
uniref:Uncharacterized protein n=1 Tax=Roseihalotalea indica TaxID=2867963 RepID=A0AA49GI54_9BACT|nr:hypothetical protein K4G66_19735 [Tunicatimonas sp. TK19036]